MSKADKFLYGIAVLFSSIVIRISLHKNSPILAHMLDSLAFGWALADIVRRINKD